MGFWKNLGLFNLFTAKTPGQFASGLFLVHNEQEKEKLKKANKNEYENVIEKNYTFYACPNCHITVNPSDNFCRNCGNIFNKQNKILKNSITSELFNLNTGESIDLNNINIIRAGKYKSGKNIEPGEYMFFSKSGNGYFAISTEDNFDELEDDEDEKNIMNVFIKIHRNEYILIENGILINICNLPALKLNKVNGISVYRVGIDIPNGKYIILPKENYNYGTFRIYNGPIELNSNNLIMHRCINGENSIELQNGYYLYLEEDCKIKK